VAMAAVTAEVLQAATAAAEMVAVMVAEEKGAEG